ncbi:MAG: Hercynine oxygenase [Chroococcopsis gigantea SAG 12.99]|jgi:formylglycine-generating enzyme required for sulfatase activity|nr:formylglycine-generating enzyme family protein [Chlorogloea purpurea SAG 13.99]MDV3002145.1 Hercynine oxygenase [Chroococcopsis gigantea SAG 12.99]
MDKLTRRQWLKHVSWLVPGIGLSLWLPTRIKAQSPTPTVEKVSKPLPPLAVYQFQSVRVDRSGKIIQELPLSAQYFTEELGSGISIDMVLIPGGVFTMGTPEGQRGDYTGSDQPPHLVVVPPFFMGKYAVTQPQWQAVANLPKVNLDLNPDPSYFKATNRPVETVSWFDAREFCARLSRLTGRDYELPGESRWEYACRAGTTTPYSFGETITSALANYYAERDPFADEAPGEYRQQTTPVGSFPPNDFGLYDVHGNVYEWCADGWHDNYQGAPANGEVWPAKADSRGDRFRILRGGGWGTETRQCRSATRSKFSPHNRYSVIGLRLAMSI